MDLIIRSECPICKSTSYKSLIKIPYQSNNMQKFLKNYYKTDFPFKILENKDYELLECNNCALIFQKYIPDNEFSFELYENIISKEESLKKKKDNPYFDKAYDKEISLIKKIFKKKDIDVLEFGAGWGFWSLKASRAGLNVDAFELSRSRINFMKENNLNVLEDLKLSKEYDLIYSDQTLEHIPYPNKFFDELVPKLKKGGYLMINFPSAFNFKNKLKNKYEPQKDAAHPLEHINLFNRISIKKIIHKHNLKIIYFKSFYNFNLKNFFKDLKNLFYFNNILLKKK